MNKEDIPKMLLKNVNEAGSWLLYTLYKADKRHENYMGKEKL